MKTNFRKYIAVIVCVCLTLTFYLNNSMAKPISNPQTAIADDSKVKVLQNDEKTIKVMTEYSGDDKQYKGTMIYATLDKESNNITMETVEKPKKKAFGLIKSGKEKVKKYKVRIDNKETKKYTVTDLETKKEYKLGHSRDKVVAQLPFVLWGLGEGAWLLINVIMTLLAVGVTVTAVIMVGDYAYTKAKEVADGLRKQKASKYYRAVISNNQVLIGDPLDYATCYTWVAAKGDCFAPDQNDARIMAQAVGGVARGPEIHGSLPNYMWHYQPKYANFYDSHCFF